MSRTVDCGEGRHDLCVGYAHTSYLFPQDSRPIDEEPFPCGCRCHHKEGARVPCKACVPDTTDA